MRGSTVALFVMVAISAASCSSAGAPAASASLPAGPSAASILSAPPSASTAPLSAPVDPGPSASAAASAAPPTGGLPGEPDPRLTPGATNPAVTPATIRSTICVSGWTATVRPPSSYTTSLKREQIAEYGYTDTSLADYEEDHLIPLEVGGAPSDPRNLWPEPYTVSLADGTSDGARVKDQLENKLRALVCAGSLPLATAQRAIATDWVRAWLTYVSGSGALPTTLASSPTPMPVASGTPPATTGTATGSLAVTITSLTSPVSPGSPATLTATTAAGAACSIVVVYKSGPSSASGLGPATADAGGDVTWTWTVGSRTSSGSWPVTVTCSDGGTTASAGTTLVVE